jgi:O-methyltransferase involved in polyketide biosynthesis
MSSDPKVRYVEVDRPFVVRKKRELLERTAKGRAALARPNLRLVEGDVAEVDLDALVPGDGPLAVVAEGLLMYLDAGAQRALWRRVRQLFTARPGVLVFDLVPAGEQVRRGALGSAFGWFFRRATRGARFDRDARTRDDVAGELGAAGFSVELLEPRDVLERWNLPHRDAWTQVLIFVCRPA